MLTRTKTGTTPITTSDISADTTLVYIKMSGEPRIPVTVRIEWLSDGTIKPRSYWTPDGSHYIIQSVYEMTPIAFLKDRGTGIRFKIKAVLEDALVTYRELYHDQPYHESYRDQPYHEPCHESYHDRQYHDRFDGQQFYDQQFAQHEAYLYLADSFFSGRNIIDERYGHSSKEFIPVTLDVFPDCKYELICFEVKGIRYAVEKTIAIEPRGSFLAGGIGIRHEVEARQDDDDVDARENAVRVAALYFEINKWWIRVSARD